MDNLWLVQHLSNISGIAAVCFFANGEQVQIPDHPYLYRLASNAPAELFQHDKAATCVLTDELLCYGKVELNQPGAYVIWGPVSSSACDNHRAQRILRRYGLPTTEAGQLLSFLQGLPLYYFSKFASFIIFANYVLGGQVIEILDLLPPEYSFDEGKSTAPDISVNTLLRHSARDYEKLMYSMVRLGQREKMSEFLRRSAFTGSVGSLASEPLRNYKNLVIASATMAARHAVGGGVDYEVSMNISDAYIQKVELAPDMQTLVSLHKNLLKTYTRMVWESKHNNANSAISAKAHSYIEQHLTEAITVQNIADALNLSRSYLSVQFKKETGINLNDFINQLKVDEAKSLLLTTDKSIADIANTLAFSSQGYLHAIFKKFTGMTPRSFRVEGEVPGS